MDEEDLKELPVELRESLQRMNAMMEQLSEAVAKSKLVGTSGKRFLNVYLRNSVVPLDIVNLCFV